MADEQIEHNDWPAVEVEGRVRRCGRIHEDGCHRPGELTEVGAKRIGSRRARRRKARLRRGGGLRGWVHRGGDPWHTGRRPRCGASVESSAVDAVCLVEPPLTTGVSGCSGSTVPSTIKSFLSLMLGTYATKYLAHAALLGKRAH
jgi:hypothetical protein